MYIDNFMYDMSLNDKGELVVLIQIPKDRQDENIEDVEIRITQNDLSRMSYVFKRNPPVECEDCGKPWKLGDPSKEVEESRIKCVCKECF